MKGILTQEEAERRASAVGQGVRYTLYIHLAPGTSFRGLVKCVFTPLKSDPVFFDYTGKEVQFMSVNGTKIIGEQLLGTWKAGKLTVPPGCLVLGSPNTIVVAFSNDYSKDGRGVHSYMDVEKQQYIFTCFEPFEANRLFPVFDQPDLKAPLSLCIMAPSEWKVLSNNSKLGEVKNAATTNLIIKSDDFFGLIDHYFPDDFKTVGDSTTFHIFEETPTLPSYLYAFVAGPWEQIFYDDSFGKTIPLSVVTRAACTKYLAFQKDGIFRFSAYGLGLFNHFFQIEMPFSKIDIVFCPEQPCGGMENPGLITMSEIYLYKQPPTEMQLIGQGRCLLHELSHMWFGNLVTMKWWNDLWLKEAFAEFASYLALEWINDSKEYIKINTMGIFAQKKVAAYEADQELTTRAIACRVESTETARTIFDSITYIKGANMIMQLYLYVGHSQFLGVLKAFFLRYGYRNATLHDFAGCLRELVKPSPSMPLDINQWVTEWIEKPGINILSCSWNPAIQGPSKLTINQRPALKEHPTLRQHFLTIAFFDEWARPAVFHQIFLGSKPFSDLKFVNKSYKAIMLNYGSKAYVKVEIDKISLAFFKENLRKIDNEATLMPIVQSMMSMVKDGTMRVSQFFDDILTDYLDVLKGHITIFEPTVIGLGSFAMEFVPLSRQTEFHQRLFDKLFTYLETETDPSMVKAMKMSLIRSGRTDRAVEVLHGLLEGSIPLSKKLSLNISEKWFCLFRICCSAKFSLPEKLKMRTDLFEKEKTELGRFTITRLETMEATEEAIEGIWKKVTSPETKSSQKEQEALCFGLANNRICRSNSPKILGWYFRDLGAVVKSLEQGLASAFFDFVLPENQEFDLLIPGYEAFLREVGASQKFWTTKTDKVLQTLRKRKRLVQMFDR